MWWPARASDGGFQIMVRDNGPGIPREKLDKIFTPFSQVDNRYDRQAGGTGLGLALVRGLGRTAWRPRLDRKRTGRGLHAPLSCCRPSATAPTANVARALKRKRARLAPRPFSVSDLKNRSDRIIHLELDRMRRVLEGIHFFHLELDIAVDEVVAEHAALLEEGAVACRDFPAPRAASRRPAAPSPALPAARHRDPCPSGRRDGSCSRSRPGPPSASRHRRDRDSRPDRGSEPRRACPWARARRECGRTPSGCATNRPAAPALRSRGSGACRCWSAGW